MEQPSTKIKINLVQYNWLQAGFFFMLYFLYIWLRINTVLYYQRQEPVFLLDASFFTEFLDYPGGLVEYISAFIAQIFLYSWLGALILTVIAWLITAVTKNLLNITHTARAIPLIHFIPALCLLALHSQYEHPLRISLSLLIALVGVLIYRRFAPKYIFLRILIFLFWGFMLYYIAGGTYLLFGILCSFFELFAREQPFRFRIPISLVYLLSIAFLPYLSQRFLFYISIKDAYFYLIPLGISYRPSFIPYILYFFFPFMILFQRTILPLFSVKLDKLMLIPTVKNVIIENLILFIIFGVTANFSFNKIDNARLQIDYYARHHNWQKVLHFAEKTSVDTRFIAWNVNRALYHSSQLADRMFEFNQQWGYDGLFLPDDESLLTPLHRSDQFFELGHINEAQHWAYEALSIRGRTPWTLQRLAQIHLIKNQNEIALKFLKVLAKTFHLRDWTRSYLDRLTGDESIILDEQLQKLQSSMPDSDFLVYQSDIPKDLDFMLKQKPRNKMGFEYMMIAYLLRGEVDKFIKQLHLLNNFDYTILPRHFEEAIFAYIIETHPRVPNVQRLEIKRKTIQRFKEFRKIFLKYGKNKIKAQAEIAEKFGDTYWYYWLFTKPMSLIGE